MKLDGFNHVFPRTPDAGLHLWMTRVGEGEHRLVGDVERGGGGGCEACVALARGRVKLTGYCAICRLVWTPADHVLDQCSSTKWSK
jgi:hypothetical protein